MKEYRFPPMIHPKYYNSRDFEMTYLEIPKSGCSSIKAHVNPSPTDENVPKYQVFTVVRDPIDRFISGYMELKRQKKTDLGFSEFILHVESDGFFDRHIVPQDVFIQTHFQINHSLVVFTFDEYMKRVDFHYNPTKSDKPILSKAQIERISALYAADFKYFA